MTNFPKPIGHGTFNVESFSTYRTRLGSEFDQIPDFVIETWIYRHWRDFQDWLVLEPMRWEYSLVSVSSDDILRIGHVDDWLNALNYWGNDLFDGSFRESTWLGAYMLEHGTTPAPMIVAVDAGEIEHPREKGFFMCEPYQIIEGHMRLAYLQAMIRRGHCSLKPSHKICLARLPYNKSPS